MKKKQRVFISAIHISPSTLRKVAIIVYVFLTAWLLRSVVRSGYLYQFDIDEYYHAQLVYLIANGQKAFTSFYASVYPPLFHWLLLPLFSYTGPVYSFLYASRILMGVLMGIRLFASGYIAYRLFGRIGAFLSVSLILLDPFSTFLGMQIRPDNLMLTLFVAGLAFIVEAMRREKQVFILIGGALVSASCLVLIKILPGFAVISVLLSLYFVIIRKTQYLFAYVLGVFISFGLFFLYFSMQGSWDALVQQVVWDSINTFSQFLYPVQFGHFFLPDNFYLFGFPGKPLTWMYMWLYMAVAACGIYTSVQNLIEKPKQWKSWAYLIPAIVLLTQFIFLFTFSSVFIQYYVVVFWFAGIVAAGALAQLYNRIASRRITYAVLGSLFMIYAVFARTSVQANMFRAGFNSSETQKFYEIRWKQIPSDEYVFPGYLFRPQAHPLPYGIFFGNYPQEILARMPEFETVLEEKKVKYLLINSWEYGFLKPNTKQYIEANYTHVTGDNELWIRNQ